MAAPATTARGTPAGIRLDDGFSSKIAFAINATVSFWEKTAQPPGVDGGEPIDTTTMHNSSVRTKNVRHLKTYDAVTAKVAYDPNVYSQILSLINVNGSVSYHFPDGSDLDFYGYLQKFMPDALEEGKLPEATITIVVTNYDSVNHLEVAPAYTNVAGT